MRRFKVSAPGKLHLLGEHSVVYNKPAILAAVDRRCFVEISTKDNSEINIVSQNFNESKSIIYKDLLLKFEKAQKDWQEYDKTIDTKLLKTITSENLDYPQLVIGQFFDYFNIKNDDGFELKINSEIPVGCGMGSSGAISVSVIGALILFFNKPFDLKIINEIAFLAEQKKHGKPSGGDNSTSAFGGLVRFKKDEGLKKLDFGISEKISKNFYIINTGTPTESTGEMVSLVRSLFVKDRRFVEDIMNDQERLVNKLYVTLDKNNSIELKNIINKGELNLEKLGVVSDYSKMIIREIEKSGGVAKICGGGGVTKSTGFILIYHENLTNLKKIIKSSELNLTQLKLGVEGLRSDG